jgi:AcrR family transcriptional regulator
MPANGEVTREKIQKCALAQFRERGYDAVRVEDICSAIDITRSAFYYHFKSKDILFDSLFDEPVSITMENMARILSTDNCWQKVWFLHEEAFKWVVNIGYDLIATIMTTSLSAKDKTYFPSLSRAHFDILGGIISLGQEAGQFLNMGNPTDMAHSLRSLIIGIEFDWCTGGGKFDLIGAFKLEMSLFLQVKEELLGDESDPHQA